MSDRGAYGRRLAEKFRLPDAPAFITRTLRTAEIAVTEIVCNVENNGLTEPIPHDDAFLVTLQLRDCSAHELWLDGKCLATAALAAGQTTVYDLRRNPIVNSISVFRNLHFYLPRHALNAIAESEGLPHIAELRHPSNIGIDDAAIRGVARALLPAFAEPDRASPLFIDHLTFATAAYVAGHFGTARAATRRDGFLSAWQERQATDLLATRRAGGVTIAELADACGLPPLRFARAFRRTFGMSPHQWLRYFTQENL
jgi:AraC-like DNA-binding protein